MSGIELVAHADCIFTAAGISAIEYSALGKRALVGRKTPYTPWGCVNFASSRQEYVEALRNAAGLPLPGERQQEGAKIYTALTMADPPGSEDLRFPWGLKSYRLWPGLPGYIFDNLYGIENEVEIMSLWLDSDRLCYNVFRAIHHNDFHASHEQGNINV